MNNMVVNTFVNTVIITFGDIAFKVWKSMLFLDLHIYICIHVSY